MRFAEYFRTNGKSREIWEIKEPYGMADLLKEEKSKDKDVFLQYAFKSLKNVLDEVKNEESTRQIASILNENPELKALMETLNEGKPIQSDASIVATAKSLVSKLLSYMKKNQASSVEYNVIAISLLSLAANLSDDSQRRKITSLANMVGHKGKGMAQKGKSDSIA